MLIKRKTTNENKIDTTSGKKYGQLLQNFGACSHIHIISMYVCVSHATLGDVCLFITSLSLGLISSSM